MKKNVFLGLLLIGLVIVFFSCDSIQASKEKQPSRDSERIVGFWRDIGNRIIFEFRSNGDYFVRRHSSGNEFADGGYYMVSNSKLILTDNSSSNIIIEDYYISDNGRFLVFPYEYYTVITKDKQNILFFKTNDYELGTIPWFKENWTE